jgi:hypothetical protein
MDDGDMSEYRQASLLDCLSGRLRERVKKKAELAVVQPPPDAHAESGPESWLVCRCRSFDRPHDIARHAELESPWDWRTQSEREAAKAKIEQSEKAS